LIKSLIANAREGDVEAANFDVFQGREKDVIVLSLARSDRYGQLGFVDDARRLNVAHKRAKRGLFIIGDKDTLKHGFESGISSFMTNVSECGAVIEMPTNPRLAASLLRGDPAKVVIDSTGSRLPARTMTDPQPVLFLGRTTERKNNILPTAATWSPLSYLCWVYLHG
jgi:hypothetical protein